MVVEKSCLLRMIDKLKVNDLFLISNKRDYIFLVVAIKPNFHNEPVVFYRTFFSLERRKMCGKTKTKSRSEKWLKTVSVEEFVKDMKEEIISIEKFKKEFDVICGNSP
jgi:hypothetical protein